MALAIDFNDLEINNIGNWPLPVKAIIIGVAFVFILILGYLIDTKQQLVSLESARQQELKLRSTFEDKQLKASNLEAYKAQLATMKASFGALLRQLPEKTEVPGLLEDISHQGLATGLKFKSIRLKPEKAIDFYVELPIEISVSGSYHQFAEFVSNVASLPRIVTLHDFTIKKISKTSQEDLLMNITAKTYRYTEKNEQESGNVNNPNGVQKL